MGDERENWMSGGEWRGIGTSGVLDGCYPDQGSYLGVKQPYPESETHSMDQRTVYIQQPTYPNNHSPNLPYHSSHLPPYSENHSQSRISPKQQHRSAADYDRRHSQFDSQHRATWFETGADQFQSPSEREHGGFLYHSTPQYQVRGA